MVDAPLLEVEPTPDETLPPQDLAAERAVLGAAMMSRDALLDVAELVTPEDFYRPAHELIFRACLAVSARGDAVDAITVSDELTRRGELHRCGGLVHLLELTGSVAVVSNATHHAGIVAERAVLRRLIEAGTRITQLGHEHGSGDVSDVVTTAHKALDGVTTRSAVASNVEVDVYAALEALESDPGMATPWRALTEAIGGWRPGGLYYVGARPGTGKTVIGVQAALDCARRGKAAVVASLEMSKHEVYHRMLSLVGSVDSERLMHRRLAPADWERLGKAAAHVAGLPLTVDDRSSLRVVDVRATVRQVARRQVVGLVVVDYLQLMSSGARVESRQTEVAEFSRQLKVLARDLEVPVLALSQLNRGPEARAGRKPTMADFRESGALEQDADVAILLHRDPDEPNELKMLVEKNRHGAGDKVLTLRWEGQYSRVMDFGWSPSDAA